MRRRPEVHAPRIDPLTLGDLDDGDDTTLRPATRHDNERFTDLSLEDTDLAGSTFDGCELSGLVLDDTRLQNARVLESVLERSGATTLAAARSTWRDVRIDGCRIGAGELYDAEWSSVEVIASKVGYLNLRGAKVADVRFTDCVIEELDLRDATVERIAFSGSRVGTLSAQGATLQHVDLRGTTLDGIDDATSLRGAVIDDGQLMVFAPELARALGILVR